MNEMFLFISIFSAVSSITNFILISQVLKYDRSSNKYLLDWMKHQEEINKIISTRQNYTAEHLRKVSEVINKIVSKLD